MNFKQSLTTLPQYILPHHPLSRIMRRLTHSENKVWKNLFIKQIIHHYKVNMDEAAETSIDAYPSFNHFFTRALNTDVRQFTDRKTAVFSPADGTFSQTGPITAGTIFQAKGKNFTAVELLGGSESRAKPFNNGHFATIYLSPKDYHRLHMPVTGTLREMVHIPGRLFSVNAATVDSVPRLFARNERVATLFDTAAGPMALVLVGALFVASIETVWYGEITPPTAKDIRTWQYSENAPVLQRGEEMGRFNMGSTIIVLFGKDKITWQKDLSAGHEVQLGQTIAEINSTTMD